MTLDRLIVDLHSSFERGMCYVALSRARNLQGLKVLRLAKNMGQGINKEVEEFLQKHFGEKAGMKVRAKARLPEKAAGKPKAKLKARQSSQTSMGWF